MKISLIQENLAKALQHINKAVSNKPNIPVLANVLLETEKGRLKLSATNLDIGISAWIGSSIEQEGKLTVSARLLADFVNSLPPGKIELNQTSQSLVVSSVDNKAEFFIIPAEDFPRVPEPEGEVVIEINALELASAINKTAFAAGTDESRPVLTGILLRGKETNLTIVAVDGFRLSKKEMTLEKSIGSERLEEIVPAKALSEVEKLIKDTCKKEDTVQIYLLGGKNQMLFKVGDVELSTRLIEGSFPNFEDILPSEKQLQARLNKKEFASMLKVVSIFARNVVGNKTRFKIDSDHKTLNLYTKVVDVGNNESSLNLKDLEGSDFETAFNVKFLSDMISTIEAEEFFFETNGSMAPGVFLDPKDSDFVHVVMPMRVE